MGAPTLGGSYCQSGGIGVWNEGSIVGVQQSGTSISIESYSVGGSFDYSYPVVETTLQLVP